MGKGSVHTSPHQRPCPSPTPIWRPRQRVSSVLPVGWQGGVAVKSLGSPWPFRALQAGEELTPRNLEEEVDVGEGN